MNAPAGWLPGSGLILPTLINESGYGPDWSARNGDRFSIAEPACTIEAPVARTRKYPRAHRCRPQNSFRSGAHSCNFPDVVFPFRRCTSGLIVTFGGIETRKWFRAASTVDCRKLVEQPRCRSAFVALDCVWVVGPRRPRRVCGSRVSGG